MTKIILCFIVVLLTTTVGLSLSRLYKSKITLFLDMVNFCNAYEANLDFYQKTLDEFILEFCQTASIEFVLVVESYFNSNIKKSKELFFYKIFSLNLTDSQKIQIENMFSRLGKSDAISQKKQLSTYKYFFEKELEKSKSNYETKGKVCSKLGVVFGFFLSVLIV